MNVTKDKIGKAGTGKIAFLPVILITLFCMAALADEIIMQNGQNVHNAKVMQVGADDIEYRIGQREVIYVIRKSDVAKIVYDDGAEDVFEVPATADPIQSESETEAPQLEAEAAPAPAPEPVTATEATVITAAAVADAVLFKPKTIPVASPDPKAILAALKDTKPGDTIAVTIPIPAQMGMAAKMLKPKNIVVPLYGTTAEEIGKTLTDAKPKPGDTVKLVIPTLSEMTEGAVQAAKSEQAADQPREHQLQQDNIPLVYKRDFSWALVPYTGIPLPSRGYINLAGGYDFAWARYEDGSFWGFSSIGEAGVGEHKMNIAMILTLNRGWAYNIGPIAKRLTLEYGGSLGFGTEQFDYDGIEQFDYSGSGFYCGPFIRLRWHYLEISYRALVNAINRVYQDEKKDNSWVAGFNSHITLGVRFGVERHKYGVLKTEVIKDRDWADNTE